MARRVIIVTGTPCVGKTATARELARKLKALYINLTELATQSNLVSGRDTERETLIVDEERMKKRIESTIRNAKEDTVIVDGHYAASVVPADLTENVFVLRRNPVELKKMMRRCGFAEGKMWENLASEILDAILIDAINSQGEQKTHEIDVTSKTVDENVAELLSIMKENRKPRIGIVDWLGMLEDEGLLDDYLRV